MDSTSSAVVAVKKDREPPSFGPHLVMDRKEAVSRILINRLHQSRVNQRFQQLDGEAQIEHWKEYCLHNGPIAFADYKKARFRVRDLNAEIPEESISNLMLGAMRVDLY